jgi:hypothetical protein
MTLTKAETEKRNAARAAAGKPPLKEPESSPRKSPPPDEAPRRKKGPASKAERKRGDLRVIETGFTELLVDTPAMIGAMTADPWLTAHTTTQGPQTVARIVAEAERSDRFREVALKAVSGQSIAMLVVAIGAYVAPIGLHYGVIPGAEKLGIPKRSFKPTPAEGAPFVGRQNGAPPEAAPEPEEHPAEPPIEPA